MRRHTLTAVFGAAVVAVLLGGCVPMQISPVLNRPATLVTDKDPTTPGQLTISGTISCTRSEPVDLFPHFTQGSLEDRPGDHSIPCGPGDPQPWSLTFEVDTRFETGTIRAEIQFCTNPAEAIDEDCVGVGRWLDVTAG